MRAPLRAIWLTVTLLTAITLAACAKPSPTAPAPPAQTLPAVTGLSISGLPASFSYGQSVQLKAIATLSDGPQKETLEVAAVWQSSDKSVASVSDTGLLVVTGFGDTDVTATFQNQKAAAHVSLTGPRAPSARLVITIDSWGSSRAIFNASEITFDMSGSTGVGLRYNVTFGDGSSSSDAPTAKHIYAMTPDSPYIASYLVRATVTDALGRTDTVTQTVPVVSLGAFCCSTSWDYPRCGFTNGGCGSRQIRICCQDGRNVRGGYWLSDSSTQTVTNLTGTFSVGGDIHLVLDDGSIAFDGPVIMKEPWHMLLKVHGGHEDGRTLDFEFYNPF